MSALSPPVLRWLAAHHYVARASDLVALGTNQDQLDHLVRQGILVRCGRGVLRLVGAAPTLEHRAAAACAASTKVVVSHQSAARLWGLHGIHGDELHVLVPHRSPVRPPRTVVHRTLALGPT